MKLFKILIPILIMATVALGADNIIGDPTSGVHQLIDANGVRWNAQLAYTTNGLGDVFTLGGVTASTDNIFGDALSGNRQLLDNNNNRWNAAVFYTTDGAGNVIPIASGPSIIAWGSITGTLSNQTDLQSALNAKQNSLGFTAENQANKSTDGTFAANSDTLYPSQKAAKTYANTKEPAITAGTSAQYYRGDKTMQTLNTAAVAESSNLYYTQGRFDSAFAAKSTTNLSEGSNLYFTNARANAALPVLATYHVDKAGADSVSCGAISSPCLTISQALTNIGDAASVADLKSPKTILIGGGVYDEALTIPHGRLMTLIAQGTVILGNGAGANWSSTNSRSITVTQNNADVFGSDIKPALNIMAAPASDTTSTFIAEAGGFFISGNLNVAGDGLTNTLNLSSVKLAGNLVHTTSALTNWQAYRTIIAGTVTTTGNLVLERAYDSRFNSLVSINAYNMVSNCNFAAGMTVQSVQQNLLPNGMFQTNFAGTFTGPASSLRLDQTSDFYFRTNSAALAGGATKVLLASSSSATVTGPLSSTDWSTFNGKQASLGISNAPSSFFPFATGSLTSIVANEIIGSGKAVRAMTVENVVASAAGFTCVANPVITLYDCGTSAGDCSGGSAMASVTLTAGNIQTDGTVSVPSLAAGHYWAWEIASGTCTALNASGTAEAGMQ